jgi:hypothetical protein
MISEKSPLAATSHVRALLLYPEFQTASFWNYRDACRLQGAEYPAAPLGLMTVAAMLPKSWELRLVDRNVESLDDALLDWADIVFVGGMISQQRDHLDLVARAKARGKRVVSGGPDATSSPRIFDDSDHLVLGEAEVTLPRFLDDYLRGEAQHIYASSEYADLTTSPIPRWDLVNRRRYSYLGLQWSRGCPFNCEFCDIIELFGRVPRFKSREQVFAELDNLYALGHRGAVDIVDDNFIGNQRAVRDMLLALAEWQRAHGFPFEFGIEASLNLAGRPELLELMREAGFCVVFVGLETPDAAVLRQAQKTQNAKHDIASAIQTFYAHGMMAMAGYIIGFDGEQGSVADGILESIRESAIPVNMVGLMYALPNTQLTRRLAQEGRLADDFDVIRPDMGIDQCAEGLNFATLRPKADILEDYARVVEGAYTPEAYFDRVLRMGLALRLDGRSLSLGVDGWKADIKTFLRMVARVGTKRRWGHLWWRVLAEVGLKNPKALRYALWMGALYLHFEGFSRFIAERARGRAAEERRRARSAASAATGEAVCGHA